MKVQTVLAAAALALGALAAHAFELSSPDVAAGGAVSARQVYSEQGCTGSNVSPGLAWSGAPSGTQSFAVTVFDPDAPTGNGWWHWAILDIPAGVTKLDAGAGDPRSARAPKGAVQGVNDFRLQRPLPAARRQGSPLYLHRVRAGSGPAAVRFEGGRSRHRPLPR